MADHLKLYVFGDQTYDIQPHLKDLLQNRDNPVLEAFLMKAYDAVRAEIFKLPYQVREDVPRFTCYQDLVLWNQSGQRCIPLDMAVTCMYQLGVFIIQAEDCYHGAAVSQSVGLCTGALAAAAVSCTRSTLELIPLAVDAVTVAFRIGMHVTDVAKRVANAQDSDESWSIIVPGTASFEAVVKFCEQTTLPLTSKPYVSAYTPNGITVSGPPSSLSQFVSSESFNGLRFKNIPIYAPYHAPHLFSQSDVSEIIGELGCDRATAHSEHSPSDTSGTGSAVEGSNFTALLESAVGDALLRPIRWNDILKELQTTLRKMSPQSLSVVPIATTVDQLIHTALEQTPFRTLVPSPPAQARMTPAEDSSASGPTKPKLAIIGMSGRFPGAKDNEAFWDLLYQGLDVHKPVPPLHWDSKTHVDPTGKGKNTSATPFGCWLDDPAVFDARFFNISPREAPQIDPAQRLALMTAYEAIEQAGIVPDATPSTRRDRVGVFYGVTSNDWMETNSAQNIDTYFIPGGNRAFIPGRINYFFKFSGPSYAVDTACSSSLAGIHLACNSLWQGDIDTAIAGGTNVLTNPDFTAGLDRGHFLSRTGNCKTFDDGADGYCRGEGIGTVILKRLDDAIADNNPVLGVILGAYTNHSAESESITRPHVGAQRAIFKKILNQAAVDPYTVSYVEMHGTGTQAGDAGEMSSVLDTFAPPPSQVKKGRTSDQALYIGSAKACIGHGEAASGVSSLIKVLLMMQKNTIVPHCGIKTKINRKFPTDLHERNVNIALKPTSWERNLSPSDPRRAFINNFSAAGGNSALLLEDSPLQHKSSTVGDDPRGQHLIACSAKTGVSLQGNLRSMLAFLKQNPDISLGQLSYTTTARRIHHQHRVMLTGSAAGEICTQIETALRDNAGMTRPKSAPAVVFAFTGQGAQYPGMGKQLFETCSFFRAEMCQLDQIGRNLGFTSVLPVIQSEEKDIGVFAPVAVQLASVCFQIALSKLWASWNITPAAVVGHSLGEYAALNVAGVLSDADTIYLVGKRAALLQEKCERDTHSMLVVKGSVGEIGNVLKDKTYELACINSPIETVLAGSSDEISVLRGLLIDAGMKSTLLKVPYAFHSSQLDPIMSDFTQLASGVTFSKPQIPVLCPLNGNVVHTSGRFSPEYLASHSRKPVNMLKALLAAQSSHIIADRTMTIEIGPHPAISGMGRAVLGSQVPFLASAQRGRPTWHVLGAALKALYNAGADIRWAGYHGDFKASHSVIPLPAYSWDLKEYWIQYVNDWSLRKGDPPLVIKETSKLESTTIHRVVEESSSEGGTKEHIIVEADIARPDLNPLVQGHMVDDIPLCTPSVYADMALTLGRYIVDRRQSPGPETKNKQVDVSDMSIFKALIAKPQGPQPLQGHAEVDWTKNEAAMKFVSFDSKGKPQEHAKCTLRFTDRSILLNKLQNESSSIKARMQGLRQGIAKETAARFNRPMVYRMIRPLAQFHDDYRAIDEVVLDSATLEASASVSFGGIKKGGTFALHPAIIDAFTQSCGFTMNCNDHTDLDNEVFMNHGWGHFQVFEEVYFDRPYTSYTRMVEGKDRLWHGDVVIFDGETIVAAFEKIAIQCVPRRVLRVILSLESGIKSKKPAPAQTSSTPVKTVKAVEAHVEARVHPAATPQAPVPGPSKVSTALQIISEESGVALDELTPSSAFADLGVDSLLGLTISARFREELDLDLDFDAIFITYPTIGAVKSLIEPAGVSAIKIEEHHPSPPIATYSTAPAAKAVEEAVITSDLHEEPMVVLSSSGEGEGGDFNRALNIISEESGIAIEELTDDTYFADTGVDSLLSLVIASRFREELEMDIPIDSLFVDCPTVADLRSSLLGTPSSVSSSSEDFTEIQGISKEAVVLGGKAFGTTIEVQSISVTPSSPGVSSGTDDSESEQLSVVVPRATSLVLQGNPKTASKTLFLFPDGSGSASSYAAIPSLGADTCIVALNSPFLKQADKLRAARLDDVIIDGYLAEIRGRQPLGPYHLGGWSAGGILAYRAAQILTSIQEQVLSLSLIDSPPPLNGLDRLPPHFYEYCESLHLFGHKSTSGGSGGKPPAWLIPHFNATIDLLHEYRAAPMRPGRFFDLPKVSIIWAAACIADNPRLPKLAPHPDDTEGMKFLLERRTNFGGNGWQALFPGWEGSIVFDRVEEAHHFSMMRKPYSQKLAEFLSKAIA